MSTYTYATLYSTIEPANKVRFWQLNWERKFFEYDSETGLFKHNIYWELLPLNNDGKNYKDAQGNTVTPIADQNGHVSSMYNLCSADVEVNVSGGTISNISVSSLGSSYHGGYDEGGRYDFTNQANIPQGEVSKATLYYIKEVDGTTRKLRNIDYYTKEQIKLCYGNFTVKGNDPTITFNISMDSFNISVPSKYETASGSWPITPASYQITVIPNEGQLINGDKYTTEPFTIRYIPGRKTYIGKLNSAGNNYEKDNSGKRSYYKFDGFLCSTGTISKTTSTDIYYIEDTDLSDNGFEGVYVFNGDYEGNLTIVAQWTANTVSITYNTSDGQFSNGDREYPVSSNFTVEDEDIQLLRCTDMGAKYIGHHILNDREWIDKDANAIDTMVDASKIYTNINELLESIGGNYIKSFEEGDLDINLYVNWIINTYDVDIYGVEVDNIVVTHGVETKLYDSIDVPSGKKVAFITDPSEGVQINVYNNPPSTTITVNGDIDHADTITVNVVVDDCIGKVYFHPNTGNMISDVDAIYSIEGDAYVITFDIANANIYLPQVSDLFEYEYNFIEDSDMSWCVGSIDSTQFMGGGQTLSASNYISSGDYELHLYANWSPTYLTVIYKLLSPHDSGTVIDQVSNRFNTDDNAQIFEPSTVFGDALNGIDGYNIDNENPWVLSSHRNKKVTANYIGTAKAVTEQLYSEELIDGNLLNSARTLVLEVNWELSKYILSCDNLGGVPAMSSQEMAYNVPTVITIQRPHLEGYVFNGWSENSNGSGMLYNPGNLITIKEDTTLYAVWVTKNSLTSGSFCYIKVGDTWKRAVLMPKISNTYKQ